MLHHLLSDNESLAQYVDCSFPSFDDVKRRLMLKAREQNMAIPDHLYRLEQEEAFKNLSTLEDVLINGLEKIAIKHMELDNTKVYLKPNEQNNWQELVTYLPPLLLKCSILYSQTYNVNKNDITQLQRYYHKYILPNTRYTAIPQAHIPQLVAFSKQQNGFHDLHMHLNGALETDQVWQDYLFNPSSIYKDLKRGFQIPKVKEQLEQESRLLQPLRYVTLLNTARKLREYFFNILYPTNSRPIHKNKNVLLSGLLDNSSDYHGSYKHPFIPLISTDARYPFRMSVEALMYILLLNEIKKTKSNVLTSLFHFYLLILGLTNRLLVQQTHQNGFEQFQKHTLNEMRESSEKIYLRRYYQMHGNEQQNLRFLEGRFSPKNTESANITFINTIYKGWEKMQTEIQQQRSNISQLVPPPELKLIAHFIKRRDDKPDCFIRHKALRYDLAVRARVLSLLLRKHPFYKKKIVGIDAAASEFDAPPEVFAPTFRVMRRAGVKHFTYHAGEDFYHVISGIRAIYEAIIFCDLQKGDRIGHATAAGISVTLWARTIGERLPIKQGDYLDDLIFCYHIIVTYKLEALYPVLPAIINETDKHSFEIYDTHYPISLLERAWKMRQCCPVHTLADDRQDVTLKNIYNDEEWDFAIKMGYMESRHELKTNNLVKIYEKYHSLHFRSKFDKIIHIHPLHILKTDQIELLQLALLREMTTKEIVIETLPTSNVRIGFHRSFETYHLANWVKWRGAGKSIPPIVVGSDDTGIFATNIYNEYANIYCALLESHKMNQSSVMDVIKQLDESSQIYRFDSENLL